MLYSLKLILVIKHHLMHILIQIKIWLIEKIWVESVFFRIIDFLIIIQLIIKKPFLIFILFRIFNEFFFHIIYNLLLIKSAFYILMINK